MYHLYITIITHIIDPSARITRKSNAQSSLLSYFPRRKPTTFHFFPWGICYSAAIWSSTAELSPPYSSWPHATTDPSCSNAVPSSTWSPPCDDWFACQDCSKDHTCGLHLLDILKLILNGRAIATSMWSAPSNNWSISPDRSKCKLCDLNLLNTHELFRDNILEHCICAPCDNISPSDRIAVNVGPRACTLHLWAHLESQKNHHQRHGPTSPLSFCWTWELSPLVNRPT